MNRAEHVAWCKARALEYVDRGDLAGAVASMVSDLTKHEGTDKPAYASLGMIGLMEVSIGPGAVRRWIEGFN